MSSLFAKRSANYIEKLESPDTVFHFLLSVWPMKIKEDAHQEGPVPSVIPPFLLLFFPADLSGGLKVETRLLSNRRHSVPPSRLKSEDLHLE